MTVARGGREESSLTLSSINFAWALSTPARVKHVANVYNWLFLEQANGSASILRGGQYGLCGALLRGHAQADLNGTRADVI
jgi:hypothetical protein